MTGTRTPARESSWQRWLRQPRDLKLRRAILQVHLWSGIALGLYVFFVSVTGSVLVYRNELYVAAIPDQDAMRLVSTLIELHDTLLAGPAGRTINGVGALAVLLMAVTGIVLWWPGRARWRRGLTLHRGVGWKRLVYDLHAMIGFWSFAFIAMFAVSGVYLCFPDVFHAWADRLDPPTEANAGERFVDGALYWLAFSHFGRINGIGLPCDGPGLCDQAVKAAWALAGLAPAAMFATGATMWWNRVLRRALASLWERAPRR